MEYRTELLVDSVKSSPDRVGGPELVENYTVLFRKPLAAGEGILALQILD